MSDVQPSPERMIRLPEVAHRTGLGRSSIYRMMEAGSFPRSVKLGERAIGWPVSDVDRWIESRRTRR